VEAALRVGVRKLTLRKEVGGSEIDSVIAALVLEELAKGDLGVSVVFAQTLKIVQTLQHACSRERARRFLPAFAADPRDLLAIGITEPDTSSDYIIPADHAAARFRTTAVRHDGADHPELRDATMGALPKVFAARVAWHVVTRALELHGGYGYMREAGIEKLVRDAAAFLHSDGANRSLLLKAARFLRADPPEVLSGGLRS